MNWTFCLCVIADKRDTKISMTVCALEFPTLSSWSSSQFSLTPPLLSQTTCSGFSPLFTSFRISKESPDRGCCWHFTFTPVLCRSSGEVQLTHRAVSSRVGVWVLGSDGFFWMVAALPACCVNLASDTSSVKWENNRSKFFGLLWWMGCLAWMEWSKHVLPSIISTLNTSSMLLH